MYIEIIPRNLEKHCLKANVNYLKNVILGVTWWLRWYWIWLQCGSSVPGLGRSPGEGNGCPPQYSCWRIPWTEESCGLQSMESQRIGCDWATNTFYFMCYWFYLIYRRNYPRLILCEWTFASIKIILNITKRASLKFNNE